MSQNHRQQRPAKLNRSPWSPLALIDQGFFLFAGVASFWLAWLVWREGWHSGGWWMVGLFVAVWVIVAYLALPRLHRILSSIYTPNYFIGRTRTGDGLSGDPVNLALRGSEGRLHQAMTAAGWTRADEITPQSTWGMIHSTLVGKSYKAAPVSSLFLFGRRQDFAYQQEVDGNPKRRHHVRFWRCPTGWLLPGGHQVDWLAAGTYDKSVGLSLFTFQITHKIDENTDIERDYIVKTVQAASPATTVTLLKDFSTGYHARNGGGDSIKTDGNLPVIELGGRRDDTYGVVLDETLHNNPDNQTLIRQLWAKRPPQIFLGSLLVVVTAVISLIGIGIDLVDWRSMLFELEQSLGSEFVGWGTVTLIGLVAISLAIVIIELWLVRLVLGGSQRARLCLLTVALLVVVGESLSLTIGRASWAAIANFSIISIHLVAMIAFSSDAARRYTLRRRQVDVRR